MVEKKEVADTERIRIDIVAPFPPPYGGMAMRFERLAHILRHRGYTCRKVNINSDENYHRERPIYRFMVFIRCAWQVLRSEAHIIHTTTGSIPNAFAISIVMLVGRLSGRKVFLSIGGGEFLSVSLNAPTILRWGLKVLLTSAHILLPCNEDLEQALVNLGINPNRIVRISNALPDEIGDRGLETPEDTFLQFRRHHEPLLLYIGAMHQHFGLMDVLSAIHQLRNTWPRLGLAVLVKKGSSKDFLQQVRLFLRDKQIGEMVQIYFSVSWAVSAMKESDVLIRATNLFDGDSRAVREALAVGLPVIASDIGYRPRGVHLYEPGNVDHLVEVIREVIQMPSHRVPYIDPEGEKNIHRYEELCRASLELREL